MYPPGHIAINVMIVSAANALVRKTGKDGWICLIPLWPAMIAAILPDITDKVITDFLHWMPYGRNYLHNLTAAVGGGALLGILFRNWGIGLSWFLGLLGHLLGDFVFVPLLWPWVDYKWPNEWRNMAEGVVRTVSDVFQGRGLSPDADSFWKFNRIGVECVMLAGVVFGLQNRVLKHGFPVWAQRVALGCVLLAWGYILVMWDIPVFCRENGIG